MRKANPGRLLELRALTNFLAGLREVVGVRKCSNILTRKAKRKKRKLR